MPASPALSANWNSNELRLSCSFSNGIMRKGVLFPKLSRGRAILAGPLPEKTANLAANAPAAARGRQYPRSTPFGDPTL